MFMCPLCDKEYEKLISLSLHYRKVHNSSAKDLTVKLFYDGIEPTCGCGCGAAVVFLSTDKKFRKYISGHNSKTPGKNNWGNNKTAFENSLKTRKEMISNGVYKPFCYKGTEHHWSKGLTKDTDERIANMANSINSNKEEIKIRSDRMRRGRLDGTVPTLYRDKHSQWRGGVSSLSGVCKTHNKLYREWKLPLLKLANFKCQQCDSKDTLDIHHNDETMSSIIRKFAKKYKWETVISVEVPENNEELLDLKDEIAQAVADYHVDNKVSGKVLCRECHKKHHKSFNFKKTI